MGALAAKLGDKVMGVDLHIVYVPTPSGEKELPPLPYQFTGTITGGCVATVLIEGKPAATLGSTADNLPPHIPRGTRFKVPPTNKGTVLIGSPTVLIGGKPAARAGDTVLTCADPAPTPNSKIVVPTSMVQIG